jgi:hypothetical protein
VRYVCLVYGPNATVAPPVAGAGDAVVAAAAVQPATAAVTVRVGAGGLSVEPGPVAATGEPWRGFCLIEARDLNHAIRVAANLPSARSGCVEVRPLQPFDPE